MQGQGSSVGSFPETFEFDHISSSSNAGMEQDVYWNSMLLDPAEPQNLPSYLLPPSDANVSYVNIATQDNAGSSIWNSGRPSSSLNPINRDEGKVEHGWSASPATNPSGVLSLEERRFEAANMLSLENVNINLNSPLLDDGQSFAQNANLNDVPQSTENDAPHVSDSGIEYHAYNPGVLESEHVLSSSNHYGSSSGVEFMSEDGDGRPGSSLDGRRLACKRKNIEGGPGQSSASASASSFHPIQSNSVHSVSASFPRENNLIHSVSSTHNVNAGIAISSQSSYPSGANSSEEQQNARYGTITRGVVPDRYPPASIPSNAESSHRNFRLRINPTHQPDIIPHPFSSRDTVRRSSIWSPNETSSRIVPFNQRLESRPVATSSSSQNQPHIPVIPSLARHFPPPFLWDGVSNSRIGSSSNSVTSEMLMGVQEERNSMPRNSISEQPILIPTNAIRQLVQDSTNWNLASGSANMAGNDASTSTSDTSSGLHSSAGPTWVPQQNPTAQLTRRIAEAVRQTLLPPSGSDSGGQSSSLHLRRSGHPPTSQERSHHSRSSSNGNQQPLLRSVFLTERQSDGIPLSVRTLADREGRSRMISEIRNALDLVRRGENLRFEDVFMLDQSIFGAADLVDRHRDMRLDVDNMSYEELLALEERIGNVSTGLNEDTILKRLQQRKHSHIAVGVAMEPEPCCVCQEEYMEGDDLGTLDCGHDFHTACIKQWLMQKNLCPICKTTALKTT